MYQIRLEQSTASFTPQSPAKRHVDRENLKLLRGVVLAYVYVCACVCVQECVSVLTWVFDRLGERKRGWTKCESEHDGTKRGGMVK